MKVVFTDWGPGARSDMAALRDVFDTDHNGKLDAGDAQFWSFKIMVIDADGSTTPETLAQAGITSLNLVEDKTRQVLADGSSIDGQTTFTKDGTTATVSPAFDGVDVTAYAPSPDILYLRTPSGFLNEHQAGPFCNVRSRGDLPGVLRCKCHRCAYSEMRRADFVATRGLR